MEPECHNTTSLNLGDTPESHVSLRANYHTKPDTRRFAGIFPLGNVFVDYGDTIQQQNDSDCHMRQEFFIPFSPATQTAPLAGMDQSSTHSTAQQIITCYRAAYDGEYMSAGGTTEKGHPQIPDDQRSMYTLVAPADTQSSMDMMWKPKPKVHMRRTDQQALMQAQSQAIAMMHDAGLKPTNKIQCRHGGCADILPDIEALKYHIHIHNIADTATRHNDDSPSSARKLLAESSTSNLKAPRRSHSRSKSSLGTQRKCPSFSPLPRNLSTGSLLPSLFSPREPESSSEVSQKHSLTTVARALTPEASLNSPTGCLSARNETSSTHTPTFFRGRRKMKESIVAPGRECNSSIAMLLSPPSSTTHGRLAFSPHIKLPIPATSDIPHSECDKCAPVFNESLHLAREQFTGSRSPVRALSPTRAMSPIRNGIKRILLIGQPVNVTEK